MQNKWDFTTLGRAPNSKKYGRGILADSDGHLSEYCGCAGWPRFPPAACKILDALIVPGIISKVLETFIYFGTRLTSREHYELQDFKTEILASIKVFKNRDFDELAAMVVGQPDYRSVIKAVEHWQYFGGERDDNGHPKYLEDGTINPE